ncbi:hypothetical protein D9611_006174 [Ephemerocybe angulata]|uniref:Uncharacterized protein n=1 Tax=Ephemerocybe angulata TaxID=980116 RepID=A0A8H5FGK1_9AGAR|nr:hypothetical protein D9611_006174 [Tulosesus angulatus]
MASVEVSLAKGLYSGEELREEVLSYCDKGELAAISSTDKSFGAEAERWLYRTVSLHESRLVELVKCLETLAKNPKKAGVVKSLAVSFYDSYKRRTPEDEATINSMELMVHLAKGLFEMRSLTFLSFRPHEGMDTKLVMGMIGAKQFKLTSLFMTLQKDSANSTVVTLPWLLERQPDLAVVGLWGCGEYGRDDSGIHPFLQMSSFVLNRFNQKPLVIGLSLRGSNFMEWARKEHHITLYSYDPMGLDFDREFPVINDESVLGEHMLKDLSLEDFVVGGSISYEADEVSVVVPDLGEESASAATEILCGLNLPFNLYGKTLIFLVPPGTGEPINPEDLKLFFDFALSTCYPFSIIFDFKFSPLHSQWEFPRMEEDEQLRLTRYIVDYINNLEGFIFLDGVEDLTWIQVGSGGYFAEVHNGLFTIYY